MKQKIMKVFISSPFLDLQPERLAVKRAMEDANQVLLPHGLALLPIDLQTGARSRPPLADCLGEVGTSDVFIGLLGVRYGSVDPATGKSISELEYDKACELRKPVLMYVRHPKSLVTKGCFDTDAELMNKRHVFQQKIEAHYKRDSFRTSDDLRAHILRDLFYIILNSDKPRWLRTSLSELQVPRAVYEFFSNLNAGNVDRCVDIVQDRRLKLELRRLGASGVRINMLKELLGFAALDRAPLVDSPDRRGPLLFELAEMDDGLARACLEEVDELALAVGNLGALAHANGDLAARCLQEGDIEGAKSRAVKALRYAKRNRRKHTLAAAFRAKAVVRAVERRDRDALRCSWRSIECLIAEQEICFFCLAKSFVMAGLGHWRLKECVLARDRFGKALYIGMALPAREVQRGALRNLAKHFETHAEHTGDQTEWRHAVAAHAWYGELTRDSDPEDEEADINVALRGVVGKLGRENTYSLYVSVRDDPKKIVLEALAPYNLENFISEIGAKASPHGDHW